MSRIIGICGKAESGKDYIANYIKTVLEQRGCRVMVIHFADLLKWCCKEYFGWNGKKDEAGRALLQHVGTDYRLASTEPNGWAEIVRILIAMLQTQFNYVIVPDIRFTNEYEMLTTNYPQTKFIRVDRYTIDERMVIREYDNRLTEEQRNHPSETELEWFERIDYFFRNYTTDSKDISLAQTIALEFDKLIDKIDEWSFEE